MVLTHLVDMFYQVALTMSEVRLRVSSLQPTCFACGYMKIGTPCNNIYSSAVIFVYASFELCKVVMDYFKSGSFV